MSKQHSDFIATWHWSVDDDGRVDFGASRRLTLDESAEFLIRQAAVPATTYVHKSYCAKGLAIHLKRCREKDHDETT